MFTESLARTLDLLESNIQVDVVSSDRFRVTSSNGMIARYHTKTINIVSQDGTIEERISYHNARTGKRLSECEVVLDVLTNEEYFDNCIESRTLPSTDYIVSIWNGHSFIIALFEDYDNRENDILLPIVDPSLVASCKATNWENFGILLDLLLESFPEIDSKISQLQAVS